MFSRSTKNSAKVSPLALPLEPLEVGDQAYLQALQARIQAGQVRNSSKQRSPLSRQMIPSPLPLAVSFVVSDSIPVPVLRRLKVEVPGEAYERLDIIKARAVSPDSDLGDEIPSPVFNISGSYFAPPPLKLKKSSPLARESSLIARRSSLTANLLGVMKEVSCEFSPQVPTRQLSQKLKFEDARSHSDNTLPIGILQKETPRIHSLREWFDVRKETPTHRGVLDTGLFVDLRDLTQKAHSLALKLARRGDSAALLQWLLNKHASPDRLAFEARRLFVDHEVAKHREELFGRLEAQKEAVGKGHLPIETVAEIFHRIIDQFSSELKPAQIALETIGGGSLLLGNGEDISTVRDLVKSDLDALVLETRRLVIQMEGVAVLCASLGQPSGPVNMEAEGKRLNYFFQLLSDAKKESEEKGGQIWDLIQSDDSPFRRVSEEVNGHKKHAAQIVSVMTQESAASSFGVNLDSASNVEVSPLISERDVTEIFLNQGLLSVNEQDDEGNSLLQNALSQEHYGTAVALHDLGANLAHQNHIFEPVALNQIKISRKHLDAALVDYAGDHALLGKKNYHELLAMLNQETDISMGQMMKVLLVNSGGYEERSIKTLVAAHLGINVRSDRGALLNEEDIKRAIQEFCSGMIKLKLGLGKDAFEQAHVLVDELVNFGLENLNKPEGIAVLDQLFSMDSMQDIFAERHSDERLVARIRQEFYLTLSTETAGKLHGNIGVGRKRLSTRDLRLDSKLSERAVEILTSPPQPDLVNPAAFIDFRKKLDSALVQYRRGHCLVKFKSNYQSALQLMKTASHEMPLGDLMAVFHSRAGAWSEQSFKRLLAQELNIPGLESGKVLTEKQALVIIDQWARGRLHQRILGGDAAELVQSRRFLDALLNKGLTYYGQYQGDKKASEILNALYAIDTRDLKISAGINPYIFDSKILERLKVHLKSDESFRSNQSETRKPELARAFSASRFLFGKTSSAAQDLAEHFSVPGMIVAA